MNYRQLGQTDLQVSTISMGCWAIVGDRMWGEQDESEAIASLQKALDMGITTFDTAEGYGSGYSEELIAKALRDQRDEIVILSKVLPDHCGEADLIRHCEDSLQRLRTDYLDLYQIHWPSREIPFEESLRALETLRRQGKIRYAGVSNFGPRDLTAILEQGRVESNQLAYNLLFRAVEYELQPVCVEQEVSILCYSPLMQALLTGKFSTADEVPEGRSRSRHFSSQRPLARHGEEGCEAETFAAIDRVRAICGRVGESMGNVALAWLLHQPGVASVIAGARNPDQVRRNVAAGELSLDDGVVNELSEATAELKERLGPNLDMWQGESRIR